MVSIYADGKLIFTESLVEDGFGVISPKCTCELGAAESLEFTLPPNHPFYNSLLKLKSDIEARVGDELIFFGREVSDDRDFYKRKNVYCEGGLAFLQDGSVPPYVLKSYSPLAFITYVINAYNRTLGESNEEREATGRYFYVGSVNGVDGKTADYSSSSYAKPMDCLSAVVTNYGGYFTVSRVVNGFSLSYATEEYFQEHAEDSNQEITFGVNLLDLEEHVNAADICTVLFPYGDRIDTQDELSRYVTLGNTGSFGTDYLVADEQILNLFGRVTKSVQFQGCTTAAALKEQAEKYLANSVALAIEINIKAVDLALLGNNPRLIKVGSKVHVTSAPHEIYNQTFICSKIDYDLSNWSNTEYTFGMTKATLTGLQTNAKNSAMAIYNKASTVVSDVSTLNSEVVKIAENQDTFEQTVNEALEDIDTRLKNLGG